MPSKSSSAAGIDRLLAAATASPSDLEDRARQSQVTFAATAFAMRGGCDCKACVYLRQAVDLLLATADAMVESHATGNNP